MSDDAETVERVWWTVQPKPPTRMAKALAKLRGRPLPHVASTGESIPVSEIHTIPDKGLRVALGRQAASEGASFSLVVAARHDGTLSSISYVRREPIEFVESPESLQDN